MHAPHTVSGVFASTPIHRLLLLLLLPPLLLLLLQGWGRDPVTFPFRDGGSVTARQGFSTRAFGWLFEPVIYNPATREGGSSLPFEEPECSTGLGRRAMSGGWERGRASAFGTRACGWFNS